MLGLTPEAIATIAEGDYLNFTFLLTAILLNVLALRKLPNTPIGLEIGALLMDGLLSALTGWDYMNKGTLALHYAWFFSAIGFLVAAIVFYWLRTRKDRKQLQSVDPEPT